MNLLLSLSLFATAAFGQPSDLQQQLGLLGDEGKGSAASVNLTDLPNLRLSALTSNLNTSNSTSTNGTSADLISGVLKGIGGSMELSKCVPSQSSAAPTNQTVQTQPNVTTVLDNLIGTANETLAMVNYLNCPITMASSKYSCSATDVKCVCTNLKKVFGECYKDNGYNTFTCSQESYFNARDKYLETYSNVCKQKGYDPDKSSMDDSFDDPSVSSTLNQPMSGLFLLSIVWICSLLN